MYMYMKDVRCDTWIEDGTKIAKEQDENAE